MLVTETLEIWIHPLKVLAAPTYLKACPEPLHLSNNSSPRPSWLHFYVDSICGDCVKCAVKATLALKCSASSLAAPVSLRQSSNAETDTALGGACSHLGMCHPKTGFTEWVMHGPERDPGHLRTTVSLLSSQIGEQDKLLRSWKRAVASHDLGKG